MAARNGVVRLAAMADAHYGKDSRGALQQLFHDINDRADVLLVCGDLTNHGLPDEARVLSKDLTASVKIPVVAVLGNHDFESAQESELTDILMDVGVTVLDGGSHDVLGIGFAGVKGFAGGFGRGALGPWGEPQIKAFVHTAVEEALKLESALARLRMPTRVVLMHYAPIRETVEGEPPEIYPYLGSGRLEEPLNRFGVSAVFHGHAHKGQPEGRTSTGIPVYNVSMPLLRSAFPDRPPVRILEVPVRRDVEDETEVEPAALKPVESGRGEWRRRATD